MRVGGSEGAAGRNQDPQHDLRGSQQITTYCGSGGYRYSAVGLPLGQVRFISERYRLVACHLSACRSLFSLVVAVLIVTTVDDYNGMCVCL